MAFTYEEMADTLRAAVKTITDAQSGTIGVLWPNAPLAEAASPDGQSRWVQVSILDGESRQADMGAGNRRWRRFGVLKLSVHVELNRGDEKARQLIDAFTQGLRGQTLTHSNGSITVRAPNVTTLGRSEQWWRVDADFPFWSDDFDS